MKRIKDQFRLDTPYYLLFTGIILFIFSNGRWIIPIAAWIAPVFLLHFLKSQKSLGKLLILFVCIAISSRIMLFGIIPSLLGVLTYVLTLYYAILWFFPYLMHRWVAQKRNDFISTLIFPVAAVSAEFINNLLYGSWASLAYTQFDHLPLIQLASLTGIWGITFLVMWFGSVINWVWTHNFKWELIKSGVLIYASIFASIMLYGGLRLGVFPPQSKTTTIASFTAVSELDAYIAKLEENGFHSSLEMAMENRHLLSSLLDSMYNQAFIRNAEIITPDVSIFVWPEGMVRVLEESETDFIDRGKRLAREKNIYLLLAYFVVPLEDPARNGENKAVFINPSGETEWAYLKSYPVPGSSDKAGNKMLPLSDTPMGRISSTICYDMDFTGLLHQAGKEEVDIMLVPAWDWKAIDPLHARMAVLRAIENGFSMIRQTGEGLSIAVDYQGRTMAAMDHFTSENHVMVSQVPTKGVPTLYSVIGDLFAWVCLGFLFLTATRRLLGRKISVPNL